MLYKILEELNISKKCGNYRLRLWQCPHFIFPMLGLLIIITIVLAYILGQKYVGDPILTSMIVLVLAAVLMILNYLITQSFEELAEVSKIRADFVHIVSHHLRTPLLSFKWGLEALGQAIAKNRGQEQLEYLGILQDNQKRMLDLISELLTSTQLEEKNLIFKAKPFDLGRITEAAVKKLEPYAKAKNIQMRLSFNPGLPNALGDESWVKYAVENLLDNAVKYGEKNIEIDIKKIPHDGKVMFRVKDQGMGIDPRERRFIFSKFFRSEKAKQIFPEGTGLGLFIVKSIIKKSGGGIGFNPNKEKGSVFWFTLPAVKNRKI